MFEIKTKLEENPNGFYKISDEEYFARPELSNSDLNAFAKSPKYYKYYKSAPKKEPTPNMLLGSLVHCMVLEPKELHNRYVRSISVDRRTTAGKLAAKYFEEKNKGFIVVNEDAYEHARCISSALFENDKINLNKILNSGHAELAMFWKKQDVKMRGKIDFLSNDGCVYDLKITSNLNDFEKSIANYAYHRQASLYKQGAIELLASVGIQFKFIVVETVEPYDSAIFELDNKSIARGNSEISDLLSKYSDCILYDRWEGAYPFSENIIGLPKWY